MALIIALVSHKGAVRKSTLARVIACEYAAADWNVKIADLDISQGTSFNRQSPCLQQQVEPVIAVERFGSLKQALKAAPHVDLLILDGPPHSTAGTFKIAQASDLVILPSDPSLDDLRPSVLLAHELLKKGVTRDKIVFDLCRVGDSDLELVEAQTHISEAGYRILADSIPEKLRTAAPAMQGALSRRHGCFPSMSSDELVQRIIDLTSKFKKAA
jgi:chromosome partitioning protein